MQTDSRRNLGTHSIVYLLALFGGIVGQVLNFKSVVIYCVPRQHSFDRRFAVRIPQREDWNDPELIFGNQNRI